MLIVNFSLCLIVFSVIMSLVVLVVDLGSELCIF